MMIYNFEVVTKEGEKKLLREYEGKVLLIVNTATECGFTPQYTELEALYKKFREQGFEILDFPCNQFGGQAPGTMKEIENFCVLNYGTTFPRFSKVDVKGEKASPLFSYLIKEQGFNGLHSKYSFLQLLEKLVGKVFPKYMKNPDIKWNFTKFLISRNGEVVKRFEPMEDVSEVEKKILELIKE